MQRVLLAEINEENKKGEKIVASAVGAAKSALKIHL